MQDQTVVRARIDKGIKDQASAVLDRAGLTLSDAIRMLLEQTAETGSLPASFRSNVPAAPMRPEGTADTRLANLFMQTRMHQALAILCQQCGVSRLDLFGSAANATFDPDTSDLDFLVAFENATTQSRAEQTFALREGLMALFGRHVDLISEDALENPYLRQQIKKECVLLFPRAEARS